MTQATDARKGYFGSCVPQHNRSCQRPNRHQPSSPLRQRYLQVNECVKPSCLTSLISGLGSWDRSRELNQTCRVRVSIRGCPGRRCHCSPVCIFLGRAASRPLGPVGLSVIEMVIGGPTALIKFESSSSGPSRITVLPKSCTTKKRCMT